MSGDILIRRQGRAGRITLNRPRALNALTYPMVTAIEAALDAWAGDERVALLLIDGIGERAFCAGGDIADMYRTGREGDFAWGQRFWRDEYRMNAKLFRFPKPVVAFLQGFTMGGGVGVGCHGSHRVVCAGSAVAMPECGIGLVPDVGGSLILARAPGRLGEYLGTTGTRMGPADAIHAGFADYFVDAAGWPALKAALAASGDPGEVDRAASAPEASALAARQHLIDRHFGGEGLGDILRSLRAATPDDPDNTAFAEATLQAMGRNSPLSMACAVEMTHRLRGPGATIERALDQEYRFVARSMERGDFLEGIRAAIIDKDRTPTWRHALDGVRGHEVSQMLMPLPRADGEKEDKA